MNSEKGNCLGSTGRQGQTPGHFQTPKGFTIDKAGNTIFVADTGNNRVQV